MSNNTTNQSRILRDGIIALRAPSAIIAALKAAAIDDGRSMSSMALRLIQQGLKARGAQ